MADAPLSRQIGGALEFASTRAINNEYHLELTAKNTEALRAGQEAMIRGQAQAAALNLRAMSEIAHRQDTTNSLISDLGGSMESLLSEARYIGDRLSDIDGTLERGFSEVNSTLSSGFAMVANAIKCVVTALVEQHKTLN